MAATEMLIDVPVGETDAHTCGQCKAIFTDIVTFIEHKDKNCSAKISSTQQNVKEIQPKPQFKGIIVKMTHDNPDGRVDFSEIVVSDPKQLDQFVVATGQTNSQLYKCDRCDKAFPRSSTLQGHKQRFHTDSAISITTTTSDKSLVKDKTCTICKREFKNTHSLKMHMKTHTDEKPFKCTFPPCTFAFRTKGSQVRHERRHTDIRPFQCSKCKRSFRESGALTRHLRSQTPCTQKSDSELPNYGRNHPLPSDKPDSDEDEPIKTDLLSDQPLDFLSAVPEVPGLPPDTSTSKVPGGGLLSDEPEDVTEDEETPLPEGVVEVNAAADSDIDDDDELQIPETVEDSLQVSISNKIDSSQRAAAAKNSAAEYFKICMVCQQNFPDTYILKDHLKSYLTSGSFLCEQCTFIATSRKELTAHTTHVHNKQPTADDGSTQYMGEEPMVDARCLEDLKTVNPQQAVKEATSAMQQLLIVTYSYPDEPLSSMKSRVLALKSIRACPVCDRSFRAGCSLKLHLRTHTGERPFKCKHCPKDFPTKDTFKKHLLSHSNERSYKCGECGRLFKRISHAKEHLKSHSNERPFHCEVCDKRFKTANTFKVHQRTHNMYLPWVCKLCNKRFREKASLSRHIRSHTGEKPFTCKYCGKQFSEHGTLGRHLKAKIPCTRELAETRDSKQFFRDDSDDLSGHSGVVIDPESGMSYTGDPTVLAEFSSVVTDTQEYMSPQSEVDAAAAVASAQAESHCDDTEVTTVEVGQDTVQIGTDTYYIVDGGIELSIPDQPQGKQEDGERLYTDGNGEHYVLLDSLPDGQPLTTLADDHGTTIYMEEDP